MVANLKILELVHKFENETAYTYILSILQDQNGLFNRT
jgi:hypothetical protein